MALAGLHWPRRLEGPALAGPRVAWRRQCLRPAPAPARGGERRRQLVGQSQGGARPRRVAAGTGQVRASGTAQAGKGQAVGGAQQCLWGDREGTLGAGTYAEAGTACVPMAANLASSDPPGALGFSTLLP